MTTPAPKCELCGGTGKVERRVFGYGPHYVDCPDCQPKPKCEHCQNPIGSLACAMNHEPNPDKPSEGAVSEYCRWPECECSSGAAERCSKPIYSDDARVAKIRDEDGRPRVVAICNELIAARASITTKHLQILDLGLRIRSLEAELAKAQLSKPYFDAVHLGMLRTAADDATPIYRGVILRAYEFIAAIAEAKS